MLIDVMVYVIHRSEAKPVGKIFHHHAMGRVFYHRHGPQTLHTFDSPMGLDAVALDLLEDEGVAWVISERSDTGETLAAPTVIFRTRAVRRLMAGRDRFYLPAKRWTTLDGPIHAPWLGPGIVLDPAMARERPDEEGRQGRMRWPEPPTPPVERVPRPNQPANG